MFVAFALVSQFERLRSAIWQLLDVETSKAVPFALTRLHAFRSVRQAGSLAHRMALPFLFDQKPSVSPPPAPRQTLPNVQVASLPQLTATWHDVAVVDFQLGLLPSVTV